MTIILYVSFLPCDLHLLERKQFYLGLNFVGIFLRFHFVPVHHDLLVLRFVPCLSLLSCTAVDLNSAGCMSQAPMLAGLGHPVTDPGKRLVSRREGEASNVHAFLGSNYARQVSLMVPTSVE
jgi:hypothetical protein